MLSEVTAYLSYHLPAFLSSTFFKVFNFASGGAVSLRQLYYYITPNTLCQYPFLSFFTFLCFFPLFPLKFALFQLFNKDKTELKAKIPLLRQRDFRFKISTFELC